MTSFLDNCILLVIFRLKTIDFYMFYMNVIYFYLYILRYFLLLNDHNWENCHLIITSLIIIMSIFCLKYFLNTFCKLTKDNPAYHLLLYWKLNVPPNLNIENISEVLFSDASAITILFADILLIIAFWHQALINLQSQIFNQA